MFLCVVTTLLYSIIKVFSLTFSRESREKKSVVGLRKIRF